MTKEMSSKGSPLSRLKTADAHVPTKEVPFISLLHCVVRGRLPAPPSGRLDPLDDRLGALLRPLLRKPVTRIQLDERVDVGVDGAKALPAIGSRSSGCEGPFGVTTSDGRADVLFERALVGVADLDGLVVRI